MTEKQSGEQMVDAQQRGEVQAREVEIIAAQPIYKLYTILCSRYRLPKGVAGYLMTLETRVRSQEARLAKLDEEARGRAG